MTLEELMKEWKKLERDGIKACGLDDWDHLKGIFMVLPGIDCLDEAIIEKVVQKAIEARGWLWGFDPTFKYRASIRVGMAEFSTAEDPVSPAKALISAYLQAIRETTEVAA